MPIRIGGGWHCGEETRGWPDDIFGQKYVLIKEYPAEEKPWQYHPWNGPNIVFQPIGLFYRFCSQSCIKKWADEEDLLSHPVRTALTKANSGHAESRLQALGIETVADLLDWTESDLAAAKGVGPVVMKLVRESLAENGLSLRRLTND